jgi:ribose-phosphate pyrophosphokinase
MIWLNGKKVEISQFPNKESKIEDSINKHIYTFEDDVNIIHFRFEDDRDLIHLMIIKKHLDSLGVKDIILYCPYVPYSRMDRSVNDSVFTLKYIAEFINSLNFAEVNIHEAHSDVTPALIDRCDNKNINYNILKWVKKDIDFDIEKDYIFFPDAGAQKRYDIPGHNQLVGFKKRNWETGNIEGLDIVGNVPEYKPNRKVIIIDDLCSYGGTFTRSAKELYKNGFEYIYLLVAHCEDSIFKGSIFKEDLIDRVYTTDSILDTKDFFVRHHEETEQLKVYKLGGFN